MVITYADGVKEMNIFKTSDDVWQCALDHCHIHRNKMIVEYAQIMSTVHHLTGSGSDEMYKPTHSKHPSVLWVMESKANYVWLYGLWNCLASQYYDSRLLQHSTHLKLRNVLDQWPDLPDGAITPIRQAMPEHCKRKDENEAYQGYLNDKFVEWMGRDNPIVPRWKVTPEWLSDEVRHLLGGK